MTFFSHGPKDDPVTALAGAANDGVLAVIIRVDGPSYRPVGAFMAVFPGEKRRVGTLSSGCIENDIALHAGEALKTGSPRTVLYGRGSPYIDIQLPCGGGLEILLIPRPDRETLAILCAKHAARNACTLGIDLKTGILAISAQGETALTATRFQVRILPDLFFYTFGKGPEAGAFATLVATAGYPSLLLSPDEETLEQGRAAGCPVRHLKGAEWSLDLKPDEWSAVVLFFHDHEWEPPVLQGALASQAFYIGAQGSQRARDLRLTELAKMGVGQADLNRLYGPIGLVPSARDARTLAVSVLAEVLKVAQTLPELA